MSTERILMKARALAKRGEVNEARSLYASVLEKFPGNQRALTAIEALAQRSQPLAPASLVKHIFDLYQNGRMSDVVDGTGEAIKAYPDNAELLRLRAAGQMALGQAEDAVETYNRLVAIVPRDADAFGNRGNAQKAAGDSNAARQSFLKVLELRPGDATALSNIGNIHVEWEELEIAQEFFEAALKSVPDYGPALNNLGNVLKIKGDTAAAADVLSRAIEADGTNAEAFWNLAAVKTFEPGSREFEIMNEALANPRLTDNAKMLIGFALGKAHEDAGDIKLAFHHLSAANRLQKVRLGYRVKDGIDVLRGQKKVFAHGAIEFEWAERGTPTPVFLVGMPRSGTSLVEQMLSAHSDVHGGGEIEALNADLSRLDWKSESFASAGQQIGHAYLGHLRSVSKGARFVTDKLPINFQWIGAIFSMFPDAKVVHIRRNARATCWSNFKHYFAGDGNGFAYDLDDVVEFYLAYSALMKHWASVFGDRIFELDYDRLTHTPAPVMRDLLTYLDLDWQDACLAPERNSRAVYTSSATQVRRPIYQNSSHDWERYAEYVGSRFDALP